MKKITLLLLCLCMVLSAFGASAQGVWEKIQVDVNDVYVSVDGKYVYARNFVHEGTTYLSLRDMGTALGFEVGWDEETNTASLTSGVVSEYNFTPGEKSSETISVLVNDVNVVVDGKAIDARNLVYNDTTYLALRDIGNATGFDVYWDEPSFTAVLTSPGKERIIPSELTINDILVATVDGIEIPAIYLMGCYSYGVQMVGEDQLDAFVKYQADYYAYVIRECERLQITLTEEETKDFGSRFDETVALNGGKEAVEELLSQNGFTYEQYEDEFKQITQMDELSIKLSDYISENNEEIKKLLEEAEVQYQAEKGNYNYKTVIVKHILLPFSESETKESTKQRATEILNKLNRGERFEKLLEKNNNDPGQTDAGYVVYEGSGFVKEFEEASLNLQKGQISPLVETVYGYHIIKAIDTAEKEITLEEYINNSEYVEKINGVYDALFTNWLEGIQANYGWIM